MTALLVMWIALIGADRINLLGQHSAFVLTPFLALTPVVFLGELIRRHRARTALTLPTGALAFVVLAMTLLSLSTASVYVSRDLNSAAPRVVQLALMMWSTFGVIMAARDRPDLRDILARGARAGIAVFLAFNVAETLVWLDILPPLVPASLGMLNIEPSLYAGLVPRLSGMVVDANRGGLLLVIFAFLVGYGDTQRARAWRWMSLAAILLLLTLSRSAALAAFGTIAALAIGTTALRVPRRVLASLSAIVVLGMGTLLVSPRSRGFAATGLEPFLQRFTLVEGSSQDHMRLLERGLYVGTRSLGAAMHGLGYGSSHLALQDFFPGDRYGNFHSVYIGIFAEVGVFALVVVLILIGVPLLRPGDYRPIVAAVALYGVFYGALSEPVFWLALVLAWVGTPTANSRPNAIVKPTATARMAPSSS
jgi:hypothetical protein